MTTQAQANEAKAQAKAFLAIVESFQREGFPKSLASDFTCINGYYIPCKKSLATEASKLKGVNAIL